MLTFRLQKWLRVSAGLSLFVLLAVQEKVCPWTRAASPASDIGSPASHEDPATTNSDESESNEEAAFVPHVLPDTAAPRWSANAGHVALRQIIGARDGVQSCGRQRPESSAPVSAAKTFSTLADAFRLRRCAFAPRVPDHFIAGHPTDPSVGNAILPCGPPIA